jgi:hypothetical protein
VTDRVIQLLELAPDSTPVERVREYVHGSYPEQELTYWDWTHVLTETNGQIGIRLVNTNAEHCEWIIRWTDHKTLDKQPVHEGESIDDYAPAALAADLELYHAEPIALEDQSLFRPGPDGFTVATADQYTPDERRADS